MIISYDWLKGNAAGKTGLTWFRERRYTGWQVGFHQLVRDLFAHHKLDWIMWLLVRKLSTPRQAVYAFMSALEALKPEDAPGIPVQQVQVLCMELLNEPASGRLPKTDDLLRELRDHRFRMAAETQLITKPRLVACSLEDAVLEAERIGSDYESAGRDKIGSIVGAVLFIITVHADTTPRSRVTVDDSRAEAVARKVYKTFEEVK